MTEVLGLPPEGFLQAWAQYTTLTPSTLPQLTTTEWQTVQEQAPDVWDVLCEWQLGTNRPSAINNATLAAHLLLHSCLMECYIGKCRTLKDGNIGNWSFLRSIGPLPYRAHGGGLHIGLGM